jgi:hypothetical protein
MKNMNKHIQIILFSLLLAFTSFFGQTYANEFSPHVKNSYAAKDNQQVSVVKQAKEITIKYKLTELSLSCLRFEILKEIYEGKKIINVYEKHNEICGGDPIISHRLYSIIIEKQTGLLWSDAKSLSGQLERLE